jgi:two-component system, OmpR family, KDP operon response regulator KdpE
MAEKILVIDDKKEMTWLLERALAEEGYEVETAHDGHEGLRQAYASRPDLILLDVMMPGMDGWDMLRRLREFSDVPVIMLTAVGHEDDKVHGLDIGADDYVTKPFGMQELKARIRAALRRAASIQSSKSPLLRFNGGELIIDPASHAVTVRGKAVDLTPTEYKLLLYLAYNAGRVLTYEQILDRVWGSGYDESLSNVKLYIWYLRRKIEVDPGEPVYIQTQRGVGYFFSKL